MSELKLFHGWSSHFFLLFIFNITYIFCLSCFSSEALILYELMLSSHTESVQYNKYSHFGPQTDKSDNKSDKPGPILMKNP